MTKNTGIKWAGLFLLTMLVFALCMAPMTAAAAGEHTHDSITYTTEWSGEMAATTISANTNIVLTDAVTFTGRFQINSGKTVNLCLNGKTLDMGNFSIKNEGTLNICDCQTGGTIQSANTQCVNNTGTCVISSGIITSTATGGYGIANGLGATLHVSGGKVQAAFAIENRGVCNVSGGDIIGTTNRGIQNSGTCTVSGGTITCTDMYGVYNGTAGILTVSDGIIQGGAAGIYNQNKCTVTGGTIQGLGTGYGVSGINTAGPLFLTGSPTISGKYGAFRLNNGGTICATANEDGTGEKYTGSSLSIYFDKPSEWGGKVIVYNATEGQFTVANAKYFLVQGTGDNANSLILEHEHAWATEWTRDDAAHWHECTASGCDITENSQKDGYAEHTAVDADKDCTTAEVCQCGYVLAAARDSHDYAYYSSVFGILEECTNTACNHAVYADISIPLGKLIYNGTAYNATVTYEEGWGGGTLTVTYSGLANDGTDYSEGPIKAGEVKATISIGDVSVSVNYSIQRATPELGEVFVNTTDTIWNSTALKDVPLGWTNTAIEGTLTLDAGQYLRSGTYDYNWTFTPKDTANYKEATGTVSVTVVYDALDSIAITTPPTKTDYTYGEDFDMTGMVITATYASGRTAEVPHRNFTLETLDIDVTTTEVKLAMLGSDGNPIAVTQDITVNPKVVDTPRMGFPFTIRYTGQPISPDVDVYDGDIEIPVSEYEVTFTNNLTVGFATITVTDVAGGNYVVNGSATFEIVPAFLTGVTVEQNGSLYYTGQPQTPAVKTTGETVDGSAITFVYSLTEDGEFTAEVPAFTNAGTYTVYFKAIADNHAEWPSSFEVDIKQAYNAWKVEPYISGWVYGETPVAPVAEAEYGEVIFTYRREDESTWRDTPPVNSGNYVMKAYVPESENYYALEDTHKFTIERASAGVGIASIVKTGTEGLVDTYTITYTDDTTTTFTVTNGAQGIQGIQGVPGENGETPVITIVDGYWYIDGVNTNQPAQGIQGEKGDTGNGIAKIEKTGTEGLVDTYTITFTDGTITTFTVTNGEQGIQGIQGVPGENGETPVITIVDGYWYIDGVNTNQPAQGIQGEKGDTGNGIAKIEKTGTNGLVDTYTITFTDGTTTTFTVTNGAQGIQGIQGVPGEDGETPVITIVDGYWYINGENTNQPAQGIQGEKGDTGNGIAKIEKTGTEGLVDTYTITFTDGTSTTFTVTNGAQGIQGIQGVPGENGETPVITIVDGYWYIDGVNTNQPAQGAQGEKGDKGDKGDPGQDGREVEFRRTYDYIQWRYVGDTQWTNLISLLNITGAAGADGIDGREVELQIAADGKTLQWRYENGAWADLFDLSALKGADGTNGVDGDEVELRRGETHIEWKYTSQTQWKQLVSLDSLKGEKGDKGEDGVGVESILKTSSDGLVDTYTVTYTDGTTTTFTVTNGAQGVQGEQGIQGIQGVPGENGETPVITIVDGYWYIDGVNTEQPAQGIQGETGVGISDISKTGTDGLVDTYTITFTDGRTTTFTVTNGADGKDGETGAAGADGREVELRVNGGHIQWRYAGEAQWQDLVSLDSLKGDKGDKGDQGEKGEDGADGQNGTDGKDGADGIDGKNGIDGKDGADGKNGLDGTNGVTPHIGPNGNWWLGDTDTGVQAAADDTNVITILAIVLGALALLGNIGWAVFFLTKKKKGI